MKKIKKIDINQIISIITSNVNVLNTPIKRQKLSDWTNKAKSN